MACICHEPLTRALQFLSLGRLRPSCYSMRLEASQLLSPVLHWEAGLCTSEAGWTQPQGRTCGNAALLTVALSSSPPKPRACCPGPGVRWREWSPGPSVPHRQGCPFTPIPKPHPPRALGLGQKNTHFIFSFIFLIKGLHIIVCLTKTKVFVSEFEKHFPRINGKGSLINIF